MRFSKDWLLQWVPVKKTTADLCVQLTNAGLEVDAYKPVAPAFSGVVTAQIIAVEAHPNAEKLQICRVTDGSETLQIVCAAKNVAKGINVALAKVGAILPGNANIKKAKLRGVESTGMLCAAAELGLTDLSNGIMHLPAEIPLGKDLRDCLQLDDDIIDIDLTPNRGDCLSIKGIARELSVINQVPVNQVAIKTIPAAIDDQFDITVAAAADCPRYCGRIIRGINNQISVPLWLQQRLQRSGIRSINAVVDVANYVMLELGQPLHGFDLAKLDGQIVVRFADADEKLTLLDETEITLTADTLVIADTKKPLAIAGIMGGLDSAVADTSQDILLESAFFTPLSIMGKARRYAKHTDASHRFERGVDPQLTCVAMQRATQLILEICGGKAGPIVEQVTEKYLPEQQTIDLRRSQIARLLGMEISDEKIVDTLERLQMRLSNTAAGWQIQAPTHRFDIKLEVDLIEEIARIVGFVHIPSTSPIEEMLMLPKTETTRSSELLRQILVDHGYHETLTYSFVDPKIQALLVPEDKPIALQNPISNDASVMRTSIWSNLVPAVLRNQQHQQMRVRLFEIGRVYLSAAEQDIRQPLKIAGVLSGSRLPEQWGAPTEQIDFYDVKAEVQAILPPLARFVAAQHSALHPGQCAQVFIEQHAVGWLGMLHPKITQQLKLVAPIGLFELDMVKIAQQIVSQYQQISKFPAIRRDLAVVVAEKVTFQQLYDIVKNSVGELLTELNIFDVYRGQGIKANHKSMALSLTLQHPQKTLTDEEVTTLMQAVSKALAIAVQAELRE